MVRDVISRICLLSGVVAVGIGGSRAAGKADSGSDYDIYAFCESEPPVEQRESLIARCSSKYDVGEDYFGAGDEFFLDEDKVEFDVMYFNIDWFEGLVRDVWTGFRAENGYTTAFLYTLSKLSIEHDPENRIGKLKALIDTPYPEQLRQNIIRRNMMLMKDKKFASYLEQITKAVGRRDANSVNHRTAAFFASYFDVLFAVNRLLHPGEKRLVAFASENCTLLPADFEADIEQAFLLTDGRLPALLSSMVEKLRKLL